MTFSIISPAMEKRSLAFLVIATLALVDTSVVNPNKHHDTVFPEKPDQSLEDSGVIGNIKSGFQAASKILGLDTASGVADLVAEAFREAKNTYSTKPLQEEGSWGKALLAGLMRALSFDSAKIGAIVLNAIVFLAQLLTTSLVPRNPAFAETPRKIKDGSPIDWILQNPSDHLQNLIDTAENENLIDRIITVVQENSQETETHCIQLLICKLGPFVNKMQQTLTNMKRKFENKIDISNGENATLIDKKGTVKNLNIDNKSTDEMFSYSNNGGENDLKKEGKVIVNSDKKDDRRKNDEQRHALFRHLPEVREFIEHGDMCESKYKLCRLLD